MALEDKEGVQTRMNDVPTIPLVLCRSIGKKEAVFIDDSYAKLGDQFRLVTAQAIHKNLVKVPEYYFNSIELCPAFTDYLYGKQCLGIVSECDVVLVKGLKSGIQFFYSDELGLVIEKLS